MAPRTGDPQGFAAQAVLSHFARLIAEAIYRADRRDEHANLTALSFNEQADYERIGVFVLRLSDRSQLRAGLYAGADALIQGGIGSLDLRRRAQAVGMFTRAFMAMKAQMSGTAAPDTADLIRALVEADDQAGISDAPVKSPSQVDLATIDTATTEVM